jgi:hypothetical protein
VTTLTESLAVRLDTVVWRLGQGDSPRASELSSLADEVMRAVPSLDEVERVYLRGRLAHLQDALRTSAEELRGRMGQARQGRRALRRYHSAGSS